MATLMKQMHLEVGHPAGSPAGLFCVRCLQAGNDLQVLVQCHAVR